MTGGTQTFEVWCRSVILVNTMAVTEQRYPVPFESLLRHGLRIGDVELEVVRIAAPCRLLDDVIGEGARKALHARAGSVCRALVSGTVAVGDRVEFEP